MSNDKINIYNLVTQSNKLIESRYNLNITEQRLILAMISMINPEDEDFREYNIKISDLNKVLGLKNKNIYSEVKKITESILGKVIKIKTSTGLLQINWISSANYNDDSGTVTLKFDPSLKPYLLKIQKNFTSTRFGITAKFKSFYTTRIYLLVKQYEKVGTRTVTIEFLKELFPQYELYKDIKKRILIPAQKEIAKISDIKFDIKERKIGNKVKEVIFWNIKSQSYMPELPLFSPPLQSKESLAEIINRKYKVDLLIATRLINEIDCEQKEEEFAKIFKFIDENILRKDIKNIPGFVVDCIRKGYYKNNPSEDSQEPSSSTIFNRSVIKEEIKLDNNDKFFLELLELLKSNSENQVYEKWLSQLNFVERKGDKLILATNDKFYRDWIIREYLDSLLYPSVAALDSSIKIINIISITR